MLYDFLETHRLHLQASTGQPSENPQPKIITSMSLKTFLYDWNGYNKAIFLNINHYFADANIQYFFKYLSCLFNISNFAVYYFIAVAVFYYKNRNLSKDKFFSAYNYFVTIGIIYAFIGFSYALIKFTVDMPRPFCSQPSGEFFTVANVLTERCLSSFPSAHTAIAILISYSLWGFLTKSLKAVAIMTAVLVMLSRMALAMHYPADILYSILIVSIVIQFGKFLFKLFEKNLIRYVGEFVYKITLKYESISE